MLFVFFKNITLTFIWISVSFQVSDFFTLIIFIFKNFCQIFDAVFIDYLIQFGKHATLAFTLISSLKVT